MDALFSRKSDCRNCYKCIRNCPVKAIVFNNNSTRIIGNECVLCGNCYVICPQKAKVIRDDLGHVKKMLEGEAPVIVSLDPAFIANYVGHGINSMRRALKKLGFADAEEMAIGATIAKREYERLLRNPDVDILITSQCPSVNTLIERYYPEALKYLAPVISPMEAHCRDIKRRNPDAKIVYIGPCIARKDEAEGFDDVLDCVLTFEDLTKWLKAEQLELDDEIDYLEHSRARRFPTVFGVVKTMEQERSDFEYIGIDGIEACKASLRDIVNGKVHNCCIEMSVCAGSCVGGPCMEEQHIAPVCDYLNSRRYAGPKDFEVEQPDSDELVRVFHEQPKKKMVFSEIDISNMLKKMGKDSPGKVLNCGSCGYNTCREKAIAILEGKASIDMCMPYLKNQAVSFSDSISNYTPNGIIVADDNLQITKINKNARGWFGIKPETDISGEHIVRFLDPTSWYQVLETKKSIKDEITHMKEYNLYIEQTIIYDVESKSLIGILRNITEDVEAKKRKEELNKRTVEVADKVVDRQMRIVQEIASLLGETAAETKIALTKLKESVEDE